LLGRVVLLKGQAFNVNPSLAECLARLGVLLLLEDSQLVRHRRVVAKSTHINLYLGRL
jgi:hypothetical protein